MLCARSIIKERKSHHPVNLSASVYFIHYILLTIQEYDRCASRDTAAPIQWVFIIVYVPLFGNTERVNNNLHTQYRVLQVLCVHMRVYDLHASHLYRACSYHFLTAINFSTIHTPFWPGHTNTLDPIPGYRGLVYVWCSK